MLLGKKRAKNAWNEIHGQGVRSNAQFTKVGPGGTKDENQTYGHMDV
jgi:hypothetical protein